MEDCWSVHLLYSLFKSELLASLYCTLCCVFTALSHRREGFFFCGVEWGVHWNIRIYIWHTRTQSETTFRKKVLSLTYAWGMTHKSTYLLFYLSLIKKWISLKNVPCQTTLLDLMEHCCNYFNVDYIHSWSSRYKIQYGYKMHKLDGSTVARVQYFFLIAAVSFS